MKSQQFLCQRTAPLVDFNSRKVNSAVVREVLQNTAAFFLPGRPKRAMQPYNLHTIGISICHLSAAVFAGTICIIPMQKLEHANWKTGLKCKRVKNTGNPCPAHKGQVSFSRHQLAAMAATNNKRGWVCPTGQKRHSGAQCKLCERLGVEVG